MSTAAPTEAPAKRHARDGEGWRLIERHVGGDTHERPAFNEKGWQIGMLIRAREWTGSNAVSLVFIPMERSDP